MYIFRHITILILTLFSVGLAYSQPGRTEIRVDFRVNSSAIDPDYNGNARRVDEIVEFFRKLEADSTLCLTGVSFCGAASPEGHYQLNRRLARERLEALERLVRSRITIPDTLISRDDEYILWEHLAELVEGSDLEHKEEILAIIHREAHLVEYPGGRHIDSRIPALKQIDGGRTWDELLRRYFSSMRNASAVFISFRKAPRPLPHPLSLSLPVAGVPEVTGAPEPLPQPEPLPGPEEWRRELHVKSNLAGLALAIANIAVEADIARHWSVNIPVYYSAWNYFSSTVKFRTFTIQPEARFWFNEHNERWFVGAHFGLSYYNVATGGEYRTQDHNGTSPAPGGGLSVGYRLPVSRNKRWKMEFSVGVGAYALHHDRFRNYPNGLLVYTEKRSYFGIDQASVSLAYTIGLDRKGGRR